MLAIDEILELLGNGDWHELREVADRTRLNVVKVELISSFLAEYDFLEFDKEKRKVKLSPQMLGFLEKIRDVERGMSVAKSLVFVFVVCLFFSWALTR